MADLRLALAERLGDGLLAFGLAQYAEATLHGGALGVAERARGEVPQAIERVCAGVGPFAAIAVTVQGLHDVRELPAADAADPQQLGATEGRHGADGGQTRLGQGRAERVAQR